MKIYFFLLLALGLLFSCQPEKTEEDTSLNSQDAYTHFRNVVGEWALQPNETVVEIWQKTDDMVMWHGVAIGENGDSSFTEAFFLEMINDSLRLEVQPITSAGISLPIQYYLAEADDGKFVFTNPNHSFPKKMTYTFEDNQYELISEGDIDGIDMQTELVYKQKN